MALTSWVRAWWTVRIWLVAEAPDPAAQAGGAYAVSPRGLGLRHARVDVGHDPLPECSALRFTHARLRRVWSEAGAVSVKTPNAGRLRWECARRIGGGEELVATSPPNLP